MKSYILLVTLLIIIFCHWSSAANTGVEQRKTSAVIQLIGKRLRDLWTWIWYGENALKERCFGVARRLKFAIPMIIFKLGVIVTILAFLTIFSLKSLGLLLLLVMLNSTGVASKWSHEKHASKSYSQPQNVHFHLHPKDFTKGGHYTHSHPEYEHGWYDRNGVADDENETLEERLKKLHIYDDKY